jgi:deoxyadenosine/deoxycytidine kinase
MNKHINLQDNIFILNSRLRILRDTLVLDADPSLFLEKTMDDIIFLDHALDVLLGQVRNNNRIFERNEVLDYLADLEWEFSQVLGEFSTSSHGISAVSFPVVQDRVRSLQDRGAERRRAIGEEQKSTAAPSIEHAVSSDELNELLKDL